MPIYAYRCERCGHELDALQKISDPALADCPACGEASLRKKLTAPGFQLKGSGWYKTDFRDGAKPAAATAATAAAAPAETKAESKSDTPAPSTGCGSGCSCH
jgi:putative FmdB family regulatory protein